MPTDHFLYGAGGHGAVVLDALQALDRPVRLFDGNPALAGTLLLGVEIEFADPARFPANGHITVGDNRTRAMLLRRFSGTVADWFTIIHPHASVSKHASLAGGVFVAAQAVAGPAARIGTATIINHGVVVDHGCTVGAYCHVGPNATLGGGVTLNDGVLAGSGAVILPGVVVGSYAVIGSGAVVTRDVAPGATMVGVPAKSRLSTR